MQKPQSGQTPVQPLIAKTAGTSSAESDYYIFIANGKLVWGTGSSVDTNAWMSINVPTANAWHHIAVTLTKTKISGQNFFTKEVYLDNQKVKSGTALIKAKSVTKDLFIAYSVDANGKNYFHGEIDEVRLYRRQLSSADVSKLYALNYTGMAEFESKTASQWSVYPNPSSEQIMVSLRKGAPFGSNLLLQDIYGRTVKSLKVANGQENIQFSVADLPAGIYFLRDSQQNSIVHKIQVIK
jgi:hypothetical protein